MSAILHSDSSGAQKAVAPNPQVGNATAANQLGVFIAFRAGGDFTVEHQEWDPFVPSDEQEQTPNCRQRGNFRERSGQLVESGAKCIVENGTSWRKERLMNTP